MTSGSKWEAVAFFFILDYIYVDNVGNDLETE